MANGKITTEEWIAELTRLGVIDGEEGSGELARTAVNYLPPGIRVEITVTDMKTKEAVEKQPLPRGWLDMK